MFSTLCTSQCARADIKLSLCSMGSERCGAQRCTAGACTAETPSKLCLASHGQIRSDFGPTVLNNVSRGALFGLGSTPRIRIAQPGAPMIVPLEADTAWASYCLKQLPTPRTACTHAIRAMHSLAGCCLRQACCAAAACAVCSAGKVLVEGAECNSPEDVQPMQVVC